MTTTVRIPPRLEQALARYCVETRRSKSEVIIELLEKRFVAEAPPRTLRTGL
jgi:predicted DNA-binding protein